MTWPQASDEPLDVIEGNECQQDATLTAQRFRRAFNEIERRDADIERLRGAITVTIASMQRGGFNTDLQEHLRRVLSAAR